jgi:predicted lipid-binding transport protein (Tim44 family)
MGVVLLLGLIWAAILVPPAVRAHSARKEAFLVSFGEAPTPLYSPPRPRSRAVERRRRIAGGLLMAMAATLLIGLLPTFRAFLVVHLFLVDSFLAYIGLLAHTANRAAATLARPPVEAAPVEPAQRPLTPASPARRWTRPPVPVPAVLTRGAAHI